MWRCHSFYLWRHVFSTALLAQQLARQQGRELMWEGDRCWLYIYLTLWNFINQSQSAIKKRKRNLFVILRMEQKKMTLIRGKINDQMINDWLSRPWMINCTSIYSGYLLFFTVLLSDAYWTFSRYLYITNRVQNVWVVTYISFVKGVN
jgi:hypothetical protein